MTRAGRRALVLGLAAGWLAPLAGVGALSAVLLAAVSPPFGGLTGIGRGAVIGPVSALGAALSAWIVAGPALALGSLLFRRLGPGGPEGLPGWRATAAAAVCAWAGLALGASALAVGGAAHGRFLGELEFWAGLFGVVCAAGALWLHAAVRVMLRLGDGEGRRA